MMRMQPVHFLYYIIALALAFSPCAYAQQTPIVEMSPKDQQWIEEMLEYLKTPDEQKHCTFVSREPLPNANHYRDYFMYSPRGGLSLNILHTYDPDTKLPLSISRSISYRTDIMNPDEITVGTLFSAALVYSERLDRLDAVALFKDLYESLNLFMEGTYVSTIIRNDIIISLTHMESYNEYNLSIKRDFQ